MIRQLKSIPRAYQPDPMVRLNCEHVKPGQRVTDIGANIGEAPKGLLKCVGPGGQVHAFEPNGDLVSHHLSPITAPNFHVHTDAVSSNGGTATFFVDCRENMPAVASSLRVLDDLHESGKVRPVSVMTTTVDVFVA